MQIQTVIKRLTMILLAVLLCAGLALLAWQKWQQRPPVGVPVIQVTPEISLQPLAVLTDHNPEYVYSPTPLRQKLYGTGFWGYIPPSSRKWLASLRPRTGWTERLSGVGAQGITVVYGLKYPVEWDTTRNFKDVSDALRQAMTDAHMDFSGVSYGEQWITNGTPVEFNAGFPNKDPRQRSVAITFYYVPVYLSELKFGLMPWGTDNNEKPARLYTLNNPYYQPVAPLAQPVDALPATRTDGGADKLEVTLRAFVSGTTLAELKSQQRPSMDKKISSVFSSLVSAAAGEEAKPDGFFPDDRIAESGVIPASLFPVETREHQKKSVAVIEINQPGEETPEWNFDKCQVSYGAKEFPFWYNRNARGNGRQIFMYMDGDVSLLPQPLAVTVQLERVRNFPPDEEQTVEFPLPKRNSQVNLKSALQFWNGIHDLEKLTCGPTLDTKDKYLVQAGRESDTLRLYHNNLNLRSTEASSIKLTLIGSNGKSVEPKLTSISSISTSQSSAINFYSLRFTEDHHLYDYDSFTTASITVRSPRLTRRGFQFIVSPEKAAGPSAR